MRIEIGRRNYLAYLLLSHPAKIARLSSESRQRLDHINRAFNERIYSGDGAREYDQIHRYTEADQNDYPARALVDDVWVGEGYGRALELGAGSGYFTTRACITSIVATRSSARSGGSCVRAGGCSSSSRTTTCGEWRA